VPVASWPEFSATNLLRALAQHGVDFVVVGGIAMVVHGSPRTTHDLDICFASDQANLDALGAALIELGATLRGVEDAVPLVPDGRTLRRLSIVTLTTRQGPIDLLREPPGAPSYDDLRRRATRIELDGVAVLVASLDDLESMKRAANRTKDQLDLEEIAVIRRLRARGIGPSSGGSARPH
jgi:predicted nucleotidyltransferase